MKIPEDRRHVLFGGTFILANKLQFVGDRMTTGLSIKRWFALLHIMGLPDEPPPTITQVAAAMFSTRQNTAKMLEAMEREGLVTLEESGTDRRSRAVRVTALGRERRREIAQSSKEFFHGLYEGITPEELEVAAGVTIKMGENLERMKEELS